MLVWFGNGYKECLEICVNDPLYDDYFSTFECEPLHVPNFIVKTTLALGFQTMLASLIKSFMFLPVH